MKKLRRIFPTKIKVNQLLIFIDSTILIAYSQLPWVVIYFIKTAGTSKQILINMLTLIHLQEDKIAGNTRRFLYAYLGNLTFFCFFFFAFQFSIFVIMLRCFQNLFLAVSGGRRQSRIYSWLFVTQCYFTVGLWRTQIVGKQVEQANLLATHLLLFHGSSKSSGPVMKDGVFSVCCSFLSRNLNYG